MGTFINRQETRAGHTPPLYIVMLLSYLTVLGTTIRLELQENTKSVIGLYISALRGLSVLHIFLFAGLCFLYFYVFRQIEAARWTGRDMACILIPSAMFASAMVFGYSFLKTNSWALVFNGNLQKVKSLTAFTGYFIPAFALIALLFTWLPTRDFFGKSAGTEPVKGLWGRYKHLLEAYPFRTAFLTLFIIYVPYMIISYPAILMGDSNEIIGQGFNWPGWTSSYINLIDENVYINGHHPVVYTWFIHAGLMLGKAIFSSYNAGLFLAAFIQSLVIITAFSRTVALLVKLQAKTGVVMGVLSYFAFAPRIQNYLFLISKEPLYAVFLLQLFLAEFEILSEQTPKKKYAVQYIVFGILAGLLRREAMYVVVAGILLALILNKKNRRLFVVSGAVIILVLNLFSKCLMPALHISPSGRRDMFSVPFQQTARYVRDYPKEVTDEERAAISAVLDYDKLAENYDPNWSPGSVKLFREKTATNSDLAAYFKVWLRMGLKHPGTYIQATMNNYFKYFYPVTAGSYKYSSSAEHMSETNDDGLSKGNIDLNIHYLDVFGPLREAYSSIREGLFSIPGFSLVRSTSTYIWGVIIVVFYLLKTGEKRGLTLLLPLAVSFGFCLLATRNGQYARYAYASTVCMPTVSLLSIYFCRQSSQAAENGGANVEPLGNKNEETET